MRLFLLTCIGFIFISCSILTKPSILGKDDNNDFKVPSDTLISIEHTEYLGQCYTIVIYANGDAILTPTEYMGYNRPTDLQQGVSIKSRISQKQLIEIIREFEKADFFSFKDKYRMREGECVDDFTDGSAKTVSITIKGRKKTVYWENCFALSQMIPASLQNITDKIDEAVNTKQIL